MVFLEMKYGREWLEVGAFSEVSEAKFAMFDATRDYRVTASNGDVLVVQNKQALSRWDLM